MAALSALPTQSSLASQRIYFVLPDRYANGSTANDQGGLTGPRVKTGFDPTDPGYYHGGDLAGLAANLQRIKDLGFTALWVTPVLKQDPVENGSAAYHGYWGLDFTTVDPHLGTDQDFASVVAKAHGLGLKVYLDVVVNHTADIIQLTGTSYTDAPYRTCHGKKFNPARYVTGKFPCLKAATMPRVPFVLPGDRKLKKPAWLNDPLNYHDRGNIDFGSCSESCFEQGDFFGLDDLFTEKPNVLNGLAQIYASWITRFKVDGFRVDTAKHVNAAFFSLWVPKIRAAARAAGIDDFPIFGEVTLNDAVDLSAFVRDRGLPQVLDFPFQQVASAYAAGASGARGVADRLSDDDYFRTPNGIDPAFTTFLGNHDMGRAAEQILTPGARTRRHCADPARAARVQPPLSPARRTGGALRRRGRHARLRRRPAGASGHVPDAGQRLADAAAGRLRADRQGLVARSSPTIRSKPSCERSRACATRTRNCRPAPRSCGTRRTLCSWSHVSTSRRAGKRSSPSTTARRPRPSAHRWRRRPGRLTITIPPVSARVIFPAGIPKAAPAKPKLSAASDDLTSYYRLSATVTGGPVSVWFAIRRAGGAWQRVAADDSAPYRAFLEPGRFRKHERIQGVAVARGTDGSVAASTVASFVPNP